MKNIFVTKKMKEIENVNMDFKGQTIFEKLEEGVQYFVNPVRNEKEEDLESIKDLNQIKDQLEEQKNQVLKTKKNQLALNKRKVDQIRDLRQKID